MAAVGLSFVAIGVAAWWFGWGLPEGHHIARRDGDGAGRIFAMSRLI
ncbi:hypothetical protein [Bradyrhizobium iriomotense]|nr:hypothetical protein [Bradyrhizobium iriomotense]MBR1132501.1 hypothetical protein [Bradyrhizobium iriomotense]